MVTHPCLDHPTFQLEFSEIWTFSTSRTASKASKWTSRNPALHYFLKQKYRKYDQNSLETTPFETKISLKCSGKHSTPNLGFNLQDHTFELQILKFMIFFAPKIAIFTLKFLRGFPDLSIPSLTFFKT